MSYISEIMLKENNQNIKIIYDNMTNRIMSIVFIDNNEKSIVNLEIKTIVSILEKLNFLKL